MKNKKWKNPNFLVALKHSIDGIKYTFQNERNLKIQLVFAFSAIIIGIFLKLNYIEWAILAITIGLVLFAELINTAMELLSDLYSEEYNEKIKAIKDVTSGAVLLMSGLSVIVGFLVFLPKILEKLI